LADLFDDLLARRDAERVRAGGARNVIRSKDLPWEENRFGRMKWYLHPAITDTALRNYIFYMMELSPGGQSGRVKQQGDEVILIVEGRGWTTVDGVKHSWRVGDCVGLPLKPSGNVIQHFNGDTERPARFVSARPDFSSIFGVDNGCGFEVLEEAPRVRR
jgi:hypothetical protein